MRGFDEAYKGLTAITALFAVAGAAVGSLPVMALLSALAISMFIVSELPIKGD